MTESVGTPPAARFGASGPTYPPERLRKMATDAARRLDGSSALDIMQWAVETFEQRFCVASSMQDAVLPHLAARVRPGVKVLFLDTGLHFPETLATCDAIDAVLPIELVRVSPSLTVSEQDERYGERLYTRDPDLCCHLRKVAPFEHVLADFDAWATGARRDESASRAETAVVSWDEVRHRIRVAPLARWTQEDVDRYVMQNQLVTNPLRDRGYPSIGCQPCTHQVAPGTNPRNGRWPGHAKTECGLNG